MLTRRKALTRKTPMRRVGKRTRLRGRMNAKLNLLGIQYCEIRLPGCWRTSGLTWAHAVKSRYLVTETDWLRACRACLPCHDRIEAMSHADMERHVTEAIGRR